MTKTSGADLMKFPKGHLDLELTEIGEPSENELRVVVTECHLGERTALESAGVDLAEARPIEITGASRSFEIHWDNYVAYVVRNESFCVREKGELPLGDHLERRFETAFQRFIKETTFADDEFPGPLEHWRLASLNHVVEVISVGPPSVAAFKK